MKPNHYYAPFKNFEGWEVWLYDGTTRLDRISGPYRDRDTAERAAWQFTKEDWVGAAPGELLGYQPK
jgi:hypothetical protein